MICEAVCPWCKLLSHWRFKFREVLERLARNGCLLRKSRPRISSMYVA